MRWKHFATALAFSALAMPAYAQSPIATLGGSCTTGYSADQITAIENNIVICNGSTWQNLLSAPAADPSGSLAIGQNALPAPTATGGGTNGELNIAVGFNSLSQDTTGQQNTAVGAGTLLSNTTGSYNNIIGTNSASSNSTGGHNNALGSRALNSITTGSSNTAIGHQALAAITTGGGNVGIGALVGSTTLATGLNNILIGTSNAVDTPASNTSNFLNIGNTIFATGTNSGTVSAPAGNVGIGTASPAGVFDVEGGTAASGVGGNIILNVNRHPIGTPG